MQLKLVENHEGEGIFPTFIKDTLVKELAPCIHYEHWFSGTIEGYSTYIPEDYLDDNRLSCDYNPTELVATKGEKVELLLVVYDWAFSENQQGKKGWLPFSKLKSAEI